MLKTVVLSSVLTVVSACSGVDEPLSTMKDRELLVEAKEYFSPIKVATKKSLQTDRYKLGEKLYFEKKLSINNTISCNSCHLLDQFGVDNEKTSPGHDGTRGGRNSPTVYNAVFNFKQFWDGRAKDLTAQAKGPILNPIEHGLKNAEAALKKIQTKEYKQLFKKAFPKSKRAFTYHNLATAIASFEKTLITPSRFDDFLQGKTEKLTNMEKRGLEKFMEVGCITCHNGRGIGGNSYQMLGLANAYETKDRGRYEVSKKADDMYFFKVPSLRNISKTAPYFHDGSVALLPEAVKLMGWHQLDIQLSAGDIEVIVAFLGALDGKTETFYQGNE